MKDEEGRTLYKSEEINERWKEYFSILLNTENEREVGNGIDSMEGPIDCVKKEEVKEAIRKMKSGKAGGPSEVTSDIILRPWEIQE